MFFNNPAIRNDLQDHLGVHRRIAAGVRRPVATSMFQKYHTNAATKHVTGRNKCLAAALFHHAPAGLRNRRPTVAPAGTFLQADSFFSILARASALTGLDHRNAEQFCVAAKSSHDRRTFGKAITPNIGCERTIAEQTRL